MTSNAHEAYLETQILTATPQKIRLLLIDGALRFGRQALECWDDQQLRTQRCTAMGRCNEILTELYATIRDDGTDVIQQVREIYRFLLVRMSDAARAESSEALSEVLGVLETDRETWRLLCEQMPEAPSRSTDRGREEEDVSTTGLGAIGPNSAGPISSACPTPPQGFSLDA